MCSLQGRLHGVGPVVCTRTGHGRAHHRYCHGKARPCCRHVQCKASSQPGVNVSSTLQEGVSLSPAGQCEKQCCHDDRHENTSQHQEDPHSSIHHHDPHDHHDHQTHQDRNVCHHDHGDEVSSGHVGCCHTHYERDSRWGPIRMFLFNVVSWLGIFRYSDSVSHSLSAAVGSGLLLASSFAVQVLRPESILGQWQTLASAAATATMAGSLALSATPAFADAFYKALQAEVDTHALMALAGAGSFVLGFPLEGALLFSLFHVAHVLEGGFVDRANSNLSSLVDSLPKTIRTVDTTADGAVDWPSQQQVAVSTVATGRLIVVKPGELVPLDGVVFAGTALLGQETITGESLPVLKRPGMPVFSGAHVHDGTLVVRTTTDATDTTTARIVRITTAAMRNKAAVQTFLTRITTSWSRALLGASAVTLAALFAAGVPLLGMHGALYRTLALLTAGAPCALALAPLTFVCAVATLSRNGVIVKGSSVLDNLAGVSFVALDKTGTLSEGRLRFTEMVALTTPASAVAEADVLAAAAALSLQGSHPVCDAVLDAYSSAAGSVAGGALPAAESFRLVPGAGMSGVVGGRQCIFGSVKHVSESLTSAQLESVNQAVASRGCAEVTSVLLMRSATGNGSTAGTTEEDSVHIFTFSDMPKKDSSMGMQRIRKLTGGVGVFTGDNAGSAAWLASLVGLREGEVFAGLTPEDKAEHVSRLQAEGKSVFMVGDGLNDAPALATANVSAAFSETVDTTVAGVADVVVLRDSSGGGGRGGDVGRVAFLLQMAQKARANVLQNLGIALASMVAAVVPSLMGLLPLWVAVAVHEGSTVLVALNSCRLLFMRPRMA